VADALPIIYFARHDETAGSLSGQHTRLTGLPATDSSERNARALGARWNDTDHLERPSAMAKLTTSQQQLLRPPKCEFFR
jgi:broad specificity phosphatase PhoE